MNADQLNAFWIDAGKQIAAKHHQFSQIQATKIQDALKLMKAETGFAPTVELYTVSHTCDDENQTHFHWLPQMNQEDIDADTLANIEKFHEYVETAQNVKFHNSAKSVILLQEILLDFNNVIAPGLDCLIAVGENFTRVEIFADLGGVAIKA